MAQEKSEPTRQTLADSRRLPSPKQKRGSWPPSEKPGTGRGAGTSWFSRMSIRGESEYFIENLAMLLSSGMNMLVALEVIKTDVRSRRMRALLEGLKTDIDEGVPLWSALERTKLLPHHVVSLIKIGEASGRLSENLVIVTAGRQKERIFRSKIRSAMMYPVLILSLTVLVGTGIAWFILPRLASVFTSLKLELPLITKALIAGGKFLAAYGSVVVPLFLLMLVAFIYFLFLFPKTRFVGEALLFRLPVVRKLIQEVEVARFGYLLGTLLRTGLPVVDAIGFLREASTYESYQKLYRHLGESIEEGNSFQKSFMQYPETRKLIPRAIEQVIVASEQSGRLPETLLKIGEIFEAKTEITTKNFVVLLEPILLVIVWLGVVAVAVAVILPIYSLIGGLTGSS